MRFWDASALLPLVVSEPGTDLCMGWLREDPALVLWGMTRLEVASAIERRAREGRLTAADRAEALHRAERLSRGAHEVCDVLAVRARAVPLLGRYPLRAADAAQLGAALLASDPDPTSSWFAVLDRRLADAAMREGFRVLTWPA